MKLTRMGSVKNTRLKLKNCFDNYSIKNYVWFDLKSRTQSFSGFKCNDTIIFHKITATIKKMRLFSDTHPK